MAVAVAEVVAVMVAEVAAAAASPIRVVAMVHFFLLQA